MNKLLYVGISVLFIASSCKKEGCTDETALNYDAKAKKDDNSCEYAVVTDDSYSIPSTFVFADANGNSTVDYSGQTDRINQLSELIAKIKTGRTSVLNAQDLKDMFNNVGGNGNGNFTFTSSKQLKDKCFSLDQAMIESFMDSAAIASQSYMNTASNGQAGVLTSGTSSYLFDKNGKQYAEVVEKSIMGACFMYQALNHYFGDAQMNVDNTTAVDAANGKYYTQMEHNWDEAFGYFGVAIDFPTNTTAKYWGKYCISQDANLGSNAVMMNNFLKGRAAISNNKIGDRNTAIQTIRVMWEDICANQALKYLNDGIGYFGNDDAKFLQVMSEAYGFVYALRYTPEATRRMTQSEVDALVALFGDNFWDLTNNDLQAIKAAIEAKY